MDRRKEGGWWEPSAKDKRAPEDGGHTKYVDPDVHWIGMVCAIESQLFAQVEIQHGLHRVVGVVVEEGGGRHGLL